MNNKNKIRLFIQDWFTNNNVAVNYNFQCDYRQMRKRLWRTRQQRSSRWSKVYNTMKSAQAIKSLPGPHFIIARKSFHLCRKHIYQRGVQTNIYFFLHLIDKEQRNFHTCIAMQRTFGPRSTNTHPSRGRKFRLSDPTLRVCPFDFSLQSFIAILFTRFFKIAAKLCN